MKRNFVRKYVIVMERNTSVQNHNLMKIKKFFPIHQEKQLFDSRPKINWRRNWVNFVNGPYKLFCLF